jgi:hypothetical protein
MADLISLEEHNRRLQQKLSEQTKLRRNGIACPECGAELYDVQDNMILLSHPPQYRIHCLSCNYHGTRF